MKKPIVYIASPYTQGDVAINAHYQCKIFDQLLTDGKVLPVAPLWSHFQHVLFPRPYKDWIQYDQDMLHIYDCCLRLNAEFPKLGYMQDKSTGADTEVHTFEKMQKPVFYSVEELYLWAESDKGLGK